MKLATAAQARELDRQATEERGIPARELMEAAGFAVARDLAESLPAGTVAILCGKGNNGGDGFVAARHLARMGWQVDLVLAEPPGTYGQLARWAFDDLPASVNVVDADSKLLFTEWLSGHDAAVDALLGTGFSGQLRPPYGRLVSAINNARIPVVSVDIPSGLNADTGEGDPAVIAWRTVTIGLPKRGLVMRRGPELSGTVRVEPITYPKDLLDACPSHEETLTPAEAATLLPGRPRDANKGTFGMVTVCAGSVAMPGAAVLAGIGALRSGCGLVRLHVPSLVRPAVMANLPEVLLSFLADGGDTEFGPITRLEWDRILTKSRAVVIGPGIGHTDATRTFLDSALQVLRLPIVFDADALAILAEEPGLAAMLKAQDILTPHPGEMAALLGIKAEEVQADRWAAAKAAAERYKCNIVLKGAGTLVAHRAGRITHIPTGNTAWSRGGAGDVLAGLIGGLLAQGASPGAAARLGAFVHGMAADIYARDRSVRGGTVREIAECLPIAFRELERA